MIDIKFSEDSGKIKFTAKGHADTAPAGKDLVCAAATTLAYTIAQNLVALEGSLKCKPKVNISPGDVEIIATPMGQAYPKIMFMFAVVEQGAYMLAGNYPEAISLTTFGNA